MATPFHDVLFPVDISYGMTGGPTYKTDVTELVSGYEQRNNVWTNGRCQYNVSHGLKNSTQVTTLLNFFRARKGKAYSFRFKDWSDYKVTAGAIGTGDAATTVFQLVKLYTSGTTTETRTITKPVSGTLKIYLAGVEQPSGWSCDYTTGLVTFTSAPGSSVAITATFDFEVPVRFDTDEMNLSVDLPNYSSWGNIKLIEVKGE